MFLLKCLAAGAIAVVAGEIVTRRALKKAEECADEIIENALDKAEQRANTFVHSAVDDAVDLAIDRFEANTGLPLYYGNRRPRINDLIHRFLRRRREEAPNEGHQSGSPQMA